MDRLYILSQLQAHANALRFLCEDVFLFNKLPTVTHNQTVTNDDKDDNVISTHLFPPLPPSIILYVLWNNNSSAQSFVDGTITDCVRRCLQANGDDDTSAAHGTSGGAEQEDNIMLCRRRRRHQQQWQLHQEGEHRRKEQQKQQQQLTRIYIVVDRISPPLPSAPPLLDSGNSLLHQLPTHDDNIAQDDINIGAIKDHRYNCEVAIAKQLARAASTSSYLRERIDGITIGIASDDRATPGLEACMDAVERGAKERRKCAERHQARRYRGDCGGGGGISMWWTTPTSSASAAKTTESKHNSTNAGVDDDEDGGFHERRKKYMLGHIRAKSPERSPVAIVAMHQGDLDRVDHHHHHIQENQKQSHAATNNILQCRVSTEWNGNGECNTFADRAMGDWREVWFEHGTCGGKDGIVDKGYVTRSSRKFNSRPKVSRIWKCSSDGEEYDSNENCDEPISTAMVTVFLIAVVVHVWNTYGDVIHSFLLSLSNNREDSFLT